ncbi:type VI secretion system baseplate subunit TssE [Aquabacterium sp.]|jgi:type VI secretion system protein ImpF|uniref:type VI secretion system baseplate subunit TssE n=1 Tax=Aquabacterium sp. TaxID=1872578 RepID=UPI00248915EA|nr:type VI secretion system baseplate subunit TssE [Aquabacterium sp.]MDI1349756.1 type VI secretion system baseplate subunit TssE [Aquabacterium sp.]
MSSSLRIRRSLFDRLLGAHQEVPDGVMPTYTLDQLRDAVAADLERLLNTRTALHADSASLGPHARRSVLSFGVRDFASRVLASSEDQRHIARSLTQAIERHEPRLRHVHVDVRVDASTGTALQFTVRAMLVVTPLNEGVSFDAVLMPAASRYHVTQSRFMHAA